MAVAVPTREGRASEALDPRGPALEWGTTRIRKALKRHDDRCSRYAARERVWLATREGEQQDARIINQQIRFAYQRIDVLMAHLTTDKPVARVAPLRPGPECEKSAKAAQRAHNIWRRKDHRDEKEIELALNACIFGTAPYKEIWDYERKQVKRRVVKKSFMGLGTPRFEEVEDWTVTKDQPSMIPWNPYDYAWDPRAVDEDSMRYVVLFSYPTKAELLAMQRQGIYSNIDDLSANTSRSAAQFQRPGRDRDLEGCIEVAEIWDIEENRQVSIANRTTAICDQASPYWHGQVPGGICTTQPNLWTLDGTSEVEIVAAIQAEMHSFRDNWITDARLATKLLVIVDSSVDPKEIEKINNALILDESRPVQVLPIDPGAAPPTTWNPGANLVPLGEQIIAALTKDMDDMSGVNQYISGQVDQVDPKTATEVQQLSTAAERRVNAKKNQLGRGYERASVFDLRNMKQFMNTPLIVRLDGNVPDAAISQGGVSGDYSFDSIDPQDVVDADFELLMSNADETIDKQEERNQWMTLFNTLVAALPAFPPGSAMPNYAKLVERLLEAYDVEDPDEFMTDPVVLAPVDPNVPPGAAGEPPPGGVDPGVGASPLGSVTPPSFMGGPGQAAPNPGGVA